MIFPKKHCLRRFALLLLFLSLQTGLARAAAIPPLTGKAVKAQSQQIRLFIIGNSFSQNASAYLPQLVQEGGHTLLVGRAELGGCSLQRHWEIVEAAEANPEDPKGKPYKGKSLKMLLSEGQWDIITLQQNSMNSSDPATYSPYARKLYGYIKALQPQAEIVLHQTWAYRTDARTFGLIGGNQHAQDARQMWERSRAAYRALASELGLRIIPTGDAFWQVNTHPAWGYKKDEHYNFSSSLKPALPDQTHSLHVGYTWKQDNTLGFDANHANEAGRFLGSLTWYSFLFGESPTAIRFVPEKVPQDFAAYLKKAAKTAVREGKKADKRTAGR
jgi:hypothetical protein